MACSYGELMRVAQIGEGVWLVYYSYTPPVQGVAVYYYPVSRVWRCEQCGVEASCIHISAVKRNRRKSW